MSESTADQRFSCSDRERVAFEAGIKLGGAFHQFVGSAVSRRNVESLERAVEGCLLQQPYVREARVTVDRDGLGGKEHEFDYSSLTGEMLSVRLVVEYGNARARAGMQLAPEMDYPLMYVVIEERGGDYFFALIGLTRPASSSTR